MDRIPSYSTLVEGLERRLKNWLNNLISWFNDSNSSEQRKEFLQALTIYISAFGASIAIYASLFGFIVDAAALKILPSVFFHKNDFFPILVGFTLCFLSIVGIATLLLREAKSDRESLANSLENINKNLLQRNEERLDRFVRFYCECKPINIIHMVVWRGYEELISILQHKLFTNSEKNSLALMVVPYEMSEITSLIGNVPNTFSRLAIRRGIKCSVPEFAIVDHEIFQLLLNGELVTEVLNLPEGITETVSTKIQPEILSPFKKNNAIYAVPISYDVNAIAWNISELGRNAGSYLSQMFTDPNSISTFLVSARIGLLDWYLPIMGLFAVSISPENPFSLSANQFDQLCQRMNDFQRAFGKGIILLQPENAVIELINADVHVLIGGGTWSGGHAVSSFMEKKGSDIAWVLPHSGGLIWMEALVRLSTKDRSPTAQITSEHNEVIYSHFLGEDIHQSLSQRRICSGLSTLKSYESSSARVFAFDENRLEWKPEEFILNKIQDKLRLRVYPPKAEMNNIVPRWKWEEFWIQWKTGLR